MSKKSKSKSKSKSEKNFDHNVLAVKEALIKAGVNDQKLAAMLLKAELDLVGEMAKNKGTSFKRVATQVVEALTLAKGMVLIFSEAGESPSKNLAKQLDHAEAAGKALIITQMITGNKELKIKRMTSVNIEIS